MFSGLRVVELGQYVAGPLVGQLLADLGADVLKVERPGGDPYRGEPGRFLAWNRGKRSVVLDLHTQEDVRVLANLIRGADVVVENFRPGALERLGVDLVALRQECPSLVTCSITGFGSGGPLRDAPGWEPLVHGRAGLHVGFGEHDERVWRPFPLASVTAALLAMLGTVAALWERESSGLGQHVETSLLDAALFINGSAVLQGDPPSMGTQGRTGSARVHMYPTADGWLQVVAGTDRSANAFNELLLREARSVIKEASPITVTGERLDPEVVRARSVMNTKSAREWEAILSEIGVPAGVSGQVEDWFEHPHAKASGLSQRWQDSPFGDITVAAAPIRVESKGHARSPSTGPPPMLGDSSPEWRSHRRFHQPSDNQTLAAAPSGGALANVAMLDLTRILPGPLTGRLLAELGADVIKVEPPGGEEGYLVPFMYLEGNRSKSSVEIDLKDEAGRRRFETLAAGVDVVIENARSGVWDRLRLGEEELHAINPRLVYARSKGYGVKGPYADLRAFEHVLQAMTGMQATQGGSTPPRMMTVPAADYATGVCLAISVVCSLLNGRRKGDWLTVNASLATSATLLEAEHLTRIAGAERIRDDVGDDLRGPDGARHIYQVADGWVVVFASTAAARKSLMAALGADSTDSPAIAAALAGRSVAEVVNELGAVGVPVAPSVPPQQTADDVQVRSRGLLVPLQHPTHGWAVQVGLPFTLSRNTPRIRGHSPLLESERASTPEISPQAFVNR